MGQREHFNAIAHVWDQKCHHNPSKVERILDLIGIKKSQNILDVGTGTGVLIPYLIDRIGSKGNISALDISDQMISVAQGKHCYTNVKFICADALTYESDENIWDHIICFSVFPHFENQNQAVEKLTGQLKKGGRLTIAHSQSRDAINKLHLKAGEAVERDRLPRLDLIKEYFNSANLKVCVEVDNEELFVVTGEVY